MKKHYWLFCIGYLLCFFGGPIAHAKEINILNALKEFNVLEKHVREPYPFFGLAAYYNQQNYYLINAQKNDSDSIHKLQENAKVTLKTHQWFAVTGRFHVLLLKAPGLTLIKKNEHIAFYSADKVPSTEIQLTLTDKAHLDAFSPALTKLRYQHLWTPLAFLSEKIYQILLWMHAYIGSSWIMVILLFSIGLKIILLPIGIMTVYFQRSVSHYQTILAQALITIKQQHTDPADIHHALMATYKAHGLSPFYTLKPLLSSLIQVPILIAVFNVLGEMSELAHAPFLWGGSLAYPDQIASLPLTLPLLGNTFSLLPFIMTIVTLVSTQSFKNRHAPISEVRKQKHNLYAMALAFFILFYPFPSGMVLYWSLANLLQFLQQKLVDRLWP